MRQHSHLLNLALGSLCRCFLRLWERLLLDRTWFSALRGLRLNVDHSPGIFTLTIAFDKGLSDRLRGVTNCTFDDIPGYRDLDIPLTALVVRNLFDLDCFVDLELAHSVEVKTDHQLHRRLEM